MRLSWLIAAFVLVASPALAQDDPKAEIAGWTRVVKTSSRASAMAFSADGGSLFVASMDNVDVLDPITGELRSRIESRTRDLAVLGDGSLLGIERGAVVSVGPVKGKPWKIDVKGVYKGLFLSPDGSRVAVLCGEEVAVVKLAGAGSVEHRLGGHKAGVNSVAWSRDGTTIVTAGQDGRLGLHEAKTGKLSRTLTREGACFSGVAWLDEARLVTTDFSAEILVWDVTSGEVTTTTSNLQKIQTMALAPKAGLLAAGGWGGALRLYDTKDWSKVGEVAVKELVGDVTFSPDGQRLAFTSGMVDSTLYVFVKGDAPPLAPAAAGPWKGTIPWGGSGALVFSVDGKTLLVAGHHELRAYDVSRGVPQARTVGGEGLALPKDRATFVGVKGDKVLLVEDMKVRELDGAGAEVSATPLGKAGERWKLGTVVASKDGTRLAILREDGDGAALEVVELGKKPKVLVSSSLAKASSRGKVAWSDDGQRLLVAAFDEVEVWDLKKQKLAGKLAARAEAGVFFGPKPDLVLVVGREGVAFVSLKSGEKVGALPVAGKVEAAALSPDKKRIAVVSDDGALTVLDVASGKVVASEKEVSKSGIDFCAIAFSPDGKRLAIASSRLEATRLLLLP